MRRVGLATLVVLLASSVAEAALPGPPFHLTVSPTAVVEGQPVTIRIEATPGGAGSERHDVYLLLASVEEAAFLTPAGTWAPRPVPYVGSVSREDPPIVRQWAKAWPPGRYALGLVAVPPSTDPLDRSQWRSRPAITWIEIRPPQSGNAGVTGGLLGVLGAATAAAVVLVWRAGREG